MSNVSDASGRALEYKIVDEILKSSQSYSIKGNTEVDQRRDKIKFDSLEKGYQSLFKKSSVRLVKWLDERFKLTTTPFSILRLQDSAATAGDVTDIRIGIGGVDVNLSIKHNHHAVKHQRPPSTLQQCGVAKGTSEDIEFRDKLNKVFDSFLIDAKKLNPGATLFKELKEIDSEFIDKKLYEPACKLVAETILKTCSNPSNTQAIFNFLIGNTNYYKLIVSDIDIRVFLFANIPKPKKLSVTREGRSYVILHFDNGFNISMRLHTASSRLGSSVKFDSQPIDLESSVPVEIITL